jgi:hypothetical protein
MTDKPPIPAGIWARILAFLSAGATGQIVLNVHRGKVRAVSLNEQIRDDAEAPRV